MRRAKLHGTGDYSSWADYVRTVRVTESRIERAKRIEKRLAYQHYDKPPHGGSGISWPCPECGRAVLSVTHGISSRWFPVDVERLFRR